METWLVALIWILVFIIGIAFALLIFKTDRQTSFKFVFATVIALVGNMLLLNIVANHYLVSLIVAVIIGLLYTKDE